MMYLEVRQPLELEQNAKRAENAKKKNIKQLHYSHALLWVLLQVN